MTKHEARYFLHGMLAVMSAPEYSHFVRLYRLVRTKFGIQHTEMEELDGDIGPWLDFAEANDDQDDEGPGN